MTSYPAGRANGSSGPTASGWRDRPSHLRAPRHPCITAACSDRELSRYIPAIPYPYAEADARGFIERAARAWAEGNSATFGPGGSRPRRGHNRCSAGVPMGLRRSGHSPAEPADRTRERGLTPRRRASGLHLAQAV